MTYALKKAIAGLRRISKENPSLVGDILADIERRRGSVTPEIVVEESRKKTAPLHDYFEWDDAVAGEKWRIQQAGDLIRAAVETHEGSTEIVRAFVSVGGGEYRSLSVVLDDSGLRTRLLDQALRDLQAWERKYAILDELVRVRMAAKQVYDEHLPKAEDAA